MSTKRERRRRRKRKGICSLATPGDLDLRKVKPKSALQIPKVVAPTPDSRKEDCETVYARKLDKATELESAFFATVKAGILATTTHWKPVEKDYLLAVLNELEVETAYYSHGSGELIISPHPRWEALNYEILIKINRITTLALGIELYEFAFPTRIYFEMLPRAGLRLQKII